MSSRDELGDAGRTAREQQDAGVGRVDGDRRWGSGWRNSRQLIEHEGVPQHRVGSLHLFGERRVAAEVSDRFGQLDEMVDLEPAMWRQRKDGDDPDFLQSEVKEEELEAVREVDDHAIERPQAALVQVAG